MGGAKEDWFHKHDGKKFKYHHERKLNTCYTPQQFVDTSHKIRTLSIMNTALNKSK